MNEDAQPRHNGNLDPDGGYSVSHRTGRDGKYHFVVIDALPGETGDVWLDPKQALELLAWLEQERATLEQLAREEDG